MQIYAASRLLTTQEQMDEAGHEGPLTDTDYWGHRAAGALVYARTTGRFLLPFRSAEVDEPHVWGTWGGSIDGPESPERTVRRELREEAGYAGSSMLIPLLVNRVFDAGLVYHNYLAVVHEQFEPVLNWETEKAGWFTYGEFPEPRHPGLQKLLDDPFSIKVLENAVNRRS